VARLPTFAPGHFLPDRIPGAATAAARCPRIADKRPSDLVFPAPRGRVAARQLAAAALAPGDRGGQALRQAPACQDDSVRPVGKIENPDPLAFSECACKTRLHQLPRVHDTRHLQLAGLSMTVGTSTPSKSGAATSRSRQRSTCRPLTVPGWHRSP